MAETNTITADVRRVADAIHKVVTAQGWNRESWDNAAIAAIEELMTPSEGMIRAGHLEDPLACDVPDEDVAFVYGTIFKAMLRAALREHKT